MIYWRVNRLREGTPRYLGHFTAVSIFMFLLLISSIVSVDFAFGQSQTAEGQFPQSIIASSNTDTTPHLLKLKATQQGDTEAQEVSGFNLDVTNTVSAQINSQLLVFVTDSSVRVIESKVRTTADQVIDLVPSTSPQSTNAFSLTNLPAGVYALDIITQKGNTKAAYEGILVIGQQPATIIEETTRRAGDLTIIFPSDEGPPPDEELPPTPPPSPPPDDEGPPPDDEGPPPDDEGPPPDDEGPPPDDEGPPPDDEGPPPDDEGPPPDDEGPPPDDEGPPPDDGNGDEGNDNGDSSGGDSFFG